MANDRGGLQPIPEDRNTFGVRRDFFFQARDTMGRLKDKVEALIAQMEDTLATNPTSTSALWRRLKDLVKAWIEFEAQYDRLLPGRGGFYATLQHCYFEVHARAKDALVNKQNAEDAHLKSSRTQKKFATKCSLPNRKCSNTPPGGREFTTASTGAWRKSRPAWRATQSTTWRY